MEKVNLYFSEESQPDTFCLERTGIEVTGNCTLKCKLCGAYTPYRSPENSNDFSLQNLAKAIKQYFKIVTYVEQFSITGGEPLLCPHLSALIEFLKNYENQFGTVALFTNGTIVPNQDLLMTAKDFGEKLSFSIDDYGSECSSKIKEIDAILTSYGIRHTIRNYTKNDPHCGGWFDCGDLTEKKNRTKKELEILYAKCIQPQKLHFCFNISGRYMWPCSPLQKCNELGVVDDSTEYIDLLDDTLLVETQRNKIQAIYQKKYLTACAYCNGMCSDSPRVVPAEQLTKKEFLCTTRGGGICRLYSEVQKMMKRSGETGYD